MRRKTVIVRLRAFALPPSARFALHARDDYGRRAMLRDQDLDLDRVGSKLADAVHDL